MRVWRAAELRVSQRYDCASRARVEGGVVRRYVRSVCGIDVAFAAATLLDA